MPLSPLEQERERTMERGGGGGGLKARVGGTASTEGMWIKKPARMYDPKRL